MVSFKKSFHMQLYLPSFSSVSGQDEYPVLGVLVDRVKGQF